MSLGTSSTDHARFALLMLFYPTQAKSNFLHEKFHNESLTIFILSFLSKSHSETRMARIFKHQDLIFKKRKTT